MTLATLLVLADGRLPAGSHAHSGGLEPAVAAGSVRDVASLGAFLTGRLHTSGVVVAAFAAAACARPGEAGALDAGVDARTPSPALRRASRAQGRALLRAARSLWPVAPRELHQSVALGVVAAAAGLGPREAAVAAAHGVLTGSATAGVRLLGLDPFAVHGLLARLAPDVDAVGVTAAARAADPVDDLPADSAPLLDLGAEHHATWEVRLFAS